MEKPVLFIQFIPIKIPTPEPEPKEDTTWIVDVVIDIILGAGSCASQLEA